MSEDLAVPMRDRVHRRPQPTHSLHKTPWPWHDRSGRFSWLKAASLLLTIAPGAWIAFALWDGRLGARPVIEANHETGIWAVRFILLSLLARPVRAIFNLPRIVLVRRQFGLAGLFYAIAHVVLYAWDENWVMMTVAREILERFYLEVGLVALVGLAVLGVSSTDYALRQLGRGWKRLHKLIFPVAALALFHFFLQKKANAAEPVLMAGLFAWLIVWRRLPSGPDREPLPVLGVAAIATLLAAAVEAAWYALGTNIGARRPLVAELNIDFGPQPAGQVLLMGLCMAIATALFWAAHRARWRASPVFHVALYGGGALITALLAFTFSLADDWLPDGWPFWPTAGAFVAAVAAAGLLRWWLPADAVRGRRALDAACALCLLLPLAAGLTV